MTTISRECARGLRVVQLLRDNLPEVLCALLASGERDTAGRLASLMGTTEYAELGDLATLDAVRAQGIHDRRAAAVAELRRRVAAYLERRGIALTPEAFADALARLAREGGG
jgi:hypothetical protein